MKHSIIAAVAAAAILGATTAPSAQADTQDDRYSSMLSAQGITVTPELLRAGHDACDSYGSAAIIGTVLGLEGQGLSSVQASNVILAGLRTFCPQKAPPL